MQYTKFTAMVCLALLLAGCGNSDNKTENTGEAPEAGQKTEKETMQDEPVGEERDVTAADGDYYFSGLIDHKYAVSLRLNISGGVTSGKYYYHSQKHELDLSGSIRGGKLEMDEKVKEKITGHFSGKIYDADSAVGQWKSTKGKTLEFVLYKADASRYEREMKEEKSRHFDMKGLRTFMKKFKTVSTDFEYEALPEDTPEEQVFTTEEIRTYVMPEYNPENDFGYRYYYGLAFETENYIALLFTEDYFPGAFGVHNQSLVMITVSKNGEMIDMAYLGCHCLDTNMGSNDYYATDDKFYFTKNNIRVESDNEHATLIEGEGEGEPFSEKEHKTRNITLGNDGKIGNTGY